MKPYKILIVDDDEISRTLLHFHIAPLNPNIKFLFATNGEEAITIYNTNYDIDLVIMDIRMPVLNGISAMQTIKLHNSNIPIIAQTASDIDYATGIALGFDDYLQKPIHKKTLIDALRKFVDIKRQKN
jgi:CheY-like chemotaxis protein